MFFRFFSLRNKRFRRVFRRLEAFVAFFYLVKIGAGAPNVYSEMLAMQAMFFGHFLFQNHDQVLKIEPRLYSEMPNAKTQYLRATAELVSIFLQFLIS